MCSFDLSKLGGGELCVKYIPTGSQQASACHKH
jgi:hypothetical protein